MYNLAIKINNLSNETNVDLLFSELNKLGYSGIEIYNPSDIKSNYLSDLLNKHNLKLYATHVTFDYIMDNFDEFISYQNNLGCDRTVMTYGDIHGAESLSLLTDNLKAICNRLKHNNVSLYYHNHEQEFKKYGNDKIALDIILDSADVGLEYDPYWAVTAGLDPTEIYRKYQGKINMVHMKDCNYDNDTKHIFDYRILNSNDLIIVEPDKNETDILHIAKKSMIYIKDIM